MTKKYRQFYVGGIENLKQSGDKYKKIFDVVNTELMFTINENIHFEEVENLFVNLINVKRKSIPTYENNIMTKIGISFYDNKIKEYENENKFSALLIENQKSEIQKCKIYISDMEKRFNEFKLNRHASFRKFNSLNKFYQFS